MKKIIYLSAMMVAAHGDAFAQSSHSGPFDATKHCPSIQKILEKHGEKWADITLKQNFVYEDVTWYFGMREGPEPTDSSLQLYRGASKVLNDAGDRRVICVYENETGTSTISLVSHTHPGLRHWTARH